MTSRSFTWNIADNQKIVGQERNPLEKPDGVICLSHGHGEHLGRYDHVGDFFNENNYAFLAYDQPGHGKSEGKRGHIKQYDYFHDCIDRVLQEAENAYPGVDKYLYGHSMGGNIALNYALRKKPDVAGYIITSPLQVPYKGPSAIQYAMGRLMLKVFPGFSQKTGLATSALSQDDEIVQAYINDPLVHSWMSTGLYFSLMDAAQFNLDNISQLNKRMLLTHGDHDHIVDIKGSDILHKKAGFLVNYKVWNGGFHELHNEPLNAKLFSYIINWIKSAQDD